jgi:outer membrane protein assembly factor BamB
MQTDQNLKPDPFTRVFLLVLLLLSPFLTNCGGGGSFKVNQIPPPPPGVVLSSPAILGSTLFLGSPEGKLISMNLIDTTTAPDLNWEFTGVGAVDSSPVVTADGVVYFGSNDGKVYALRAFDGIRTWDFATGGAVRSSPAMDQNGNLYVGSDDGFLYALDPQGSQLWTFPTNAPISSSPAIYSTAALFFGSESGNFYSLNLDGTQRWSFTAGGAIRSSPALDGDANSFFGADDGKLYALDKDGNLLWSFTTEGSVSSSPILDLNSNLYFGSDDGNFYALNSSGSEIWHFVTGGPVRSSAALDGAGNLYFGSDDKNFYTVSSAGNLVSLTNLNTPVRSSSIIHAGYGLLVGAFSQNVAWIETNGISIQNSGWEKFRGTAQNPGSLSCSTATGIVNSFTKFGPSNWAPDSNGILQSQDNENFSGIISPDERDNYSFQATLFSTNSDNDTIALILAAERNAQGELHSLNAVRAGAGEGNGAAIGGIYWGLVSVHLSASDAIIEERTWVDGEASISHTNEPWGLHIPGTIVKVQRSGNLIKAWTSPVDGTSIQPIALGSTLTLDLGSDPYLSRFMGSSSYGFAAHSQPKASFKDIEINGVTNCALP